MALLLQGCGQCLNKDNTKTQLPESQCGFCEGRGCFDTSMVFRQLLEKAYNKTPI